MRPERSIIDGPMECLTDDTARAILARLTAALFALTTVTNEIFSGFSFLLSRCILFFFSPFC